MCSEGYPRADAGAMTEARISPLSWPTTWQWKGGAGPTINSSTAVMFWISRIAVYGVAKLTANDFIFA